MFHEKIIHELAHKHKNLFVNLRKIHLNLSKRFVGMGDALTALSLAVASGEPLLFIGPPGTAKSRLIRAMCAHLHLLDLNDLKKEHPDYFEYLLTPFTEPGELFGFFDLAKAANEYELERNFKGSLVRARIVFLDEVFNGSSAILNSLLAVMNEGVYHDRGNREDVRLDCLFGATNTVPQTSELRALFDRFVLRCWVENASERTTFGSNINQSGAITKMALGGWLETMTEHKPVLGELEAHDFLGQLPILRQSIRETVHHLDESDSRFFRALATKIAIATDRESAISNRRLIKILKIMLIHRVYRTANNLPPLKNTNDPWAAQWQLFHLFLDTNDPTIRRHLKEPARYAS